ncbi:MAG: ABC transporter permease [Nitrospiraceae bacterium]
MPEDCWVGWRRPAQFHDDFDRELGYRRRRVGLAFHLTPAMVGEGLLFAAGMGVIGGLVPAARAARIEIVHALGQRTV